MCWPFAPDKHRVKTPANILAVCSKSLCTLEKCNARRVAKCGWVRRDTFLWKDFARNTLHILRNCPRLLPGLLGNQELYLSNKVSFCSSRGLLTMVSPNPSASDRQEEELLRTILLPLTSYSAVLKRSLTDGTQQISWRISLHFATAECKVDKKTGNSIQEKL
jgi:hypothetical protein